ncbi:hypothetical protein [Herbiconiux flava]|uniref:Uncharacterized protein n=1 Tax=Herbiconiux flava TaxID=881268 RepID=A0A852SME2_9MICO|nr:hypothetical protein [Herbiconiux flava]NYD69907.1 hypothetical protein [Herbiconiux flava]GLK16656.1 hypothetical protein GCM10017602_11380 [Herbiconiux flava]
MALPTTPVDRRTVLAGAAWSVPVIAVAVGAPAAAASTTITVDFAAAYIELPDETAVLAVIAITNSGAAVTADSATITLTGYTPSTGLTAGVVTMAFDDDLTDTVPVGGDSNDVVPLSNPAFVRGSLPGDEPLVLVAPGLALPQGTVYVGVAVSWAADNPEIDGFVIAGSFEITLPGENSLSFSDQLEPRRVE